MLRRVHSQTHILSFGSKTPSQPIGLKRQVELTGRDEDDSAYQELTAIRPLHRTFAVLAHVSSRHVMPWWFERNNDDWSQSAR